jgi:multimeric flavodoxin WrbA
MTPELKCFIDRAGFVALQNGGLFRRKIGVAVVAQRRGGGTHIQASIHHMFLMNEMVIPGSTYWNFGFGPQDGTVKNDEEAMRNMENLGNNIVWLLSKIR